MKSQNISHRDIGSEVDLFEMMKRYAKLLWKKKQWIILITILFSILWFFTYKLFLQKATKYSTFSVIQFDDPRSSQRLSPITDFNYMSGLSKAAILKSNLVLSQVVDSLNLNLIITTRGVERSKLFKSIEIDSNPKIGKYSLQRVKNNFKIIYRDPERKTNNLLLTSDYDPNAIFSLQENGLHLLINGSIFENFSKIGFQVIPERVAIEMVKSDLNSTLDRTQTLLTITYSNRDPELSAIITNAITEIYVKQLLEQKRFQTSSVLRSLEEQLAVAKIELENSENELREFRERNPFVFLAQDGQNVVSEVASYESTIYKFNSNINDLKSHIQKTREAQDFNAKVHATRQLLALLDDQEFPGALPASQQLEQYLSTFMLLQQDNYSADHPQIIKVKNQILDLIDEDIKMAEQHLTNLQNNLHRTEKSRDQFETNLRRLPRNQLRLAELERNRQIKEKIVSSIITRYNEAKVTDAAIIPDAFIIDKAQPPLVYGSMMERIQIIILGILFGLIVAIAFFVVIDIFNKTFRTAQEVESTLRLPVLATIPIIVSDKEIPENFDGQKKYDPKLIVSDYAPHVAGESFRLLRTKLIMQNEQDARSYIIASLNPGEGKSLVAANLAIVFAQQKIPSILIDADLRRGVLHHTFACDKKPGITDILIGNSPISFDAIAKVIQRTHIPNLFLLSNGIQIPNPSELLGGNRMLKLYEVLKENFGAIIFDTPPIDIIPDALILNNFVKGLILVIRYGKTHANRLNSKITEFTQIRSNLKGIVLNASEEIKESDYYKYSYYNY